MATGLRFGIVSDAHIAETAVGPSAWLNALDFAGAAGRLEHAVELFNREDVDGIVFLGDLTHLGDGASVSTGLACLAGAEARHWIARGNHDIALLGDLSDDVLFDHARLVVVDIESPDEGASFRARSTLGSWQWGTAVVFVASHFPLVSRAGELASRGFPYPGDLTNREQLLKDVGGRSAATIVLSGHLHIRESTAVDGVLQLFFASLIEYPFECSIVELTAADGRPRLTRTAFSLQSGPFKRNPTFVPQVECWQFDGSSWLPADRSTSQPATSWVGQGG